MRKNFALGVTGAVAALVIAACGSQVVDGTPTTHTYFPAPPLAVTTTTVTRTETAAPTGTAWIDPTTDPNIKVVVQWGHKPGALPAQVGEPAPGLVLVQRNAPNSCTIGIAVGVASEPGFLTAGHCDQEPGQRVGTYDDVAGTQYVRLGVISEAHVDNGAGIDRALILSPEAAGDTSIAGLPVAGVMTEAAVRQLPLGTVVCADGAISGVKCGPLVDTAGRMLRFDAVGAGGDSGGPVFLVDPAGRLTLIGLVKGGTDTYSTATYLEPTLQKFGARALVDADASRAVAGDDRYSDLVAVG